MNVVCDQRYVAQNLHRGKWKFQIWRVKELGVEVNYVNVVNTFYITQVLSNTCVMCTDSG